MAEPGEVESEFGVPIPGRILPREEWTQTALKRLPPPPLKFSEIFGRTAPVVVEFGCGNGRFTLLSALQRPDHDHFASDVLPAVIRYATRRGNQRGLCNVRFAVKDAQTLARDYFAAGTVAEVHVYHPQPFHDRRDMRKRLVTPQFVANVYRALQPGGLCVIQTDSPEYWTYMKLVVGEFFDFQVQPGPWPDAPEGRSRREILARSRGLEIFRGFGRKQAQLSGSEINALLQKLPQPTFRTRGPWCELDALEAQCE